MQKNHQFGSLPSAAWDALQATVERFEAAWDSGAPPAIEDYLSAEPARRSAVLIELVHVDLERRLKARLPARVEDYLQRFPELAQTPRLVADLIVAEYGHCRGLGHNPQLEDYLRRFPEYRTQLAERLGSSAEETDVTTDEVTALPQDLPARLGRYRIEAEIGKGGMGQVVRVFDEDFGRPLAMKVLLESGRQQPGLAERFLGEARLTGQLQHPGIPPVQELGQLPDGRPYFIMKLIRGQSLQALLKERTTPNQDLPRLLSIFEQICQTLGYAHAHGILHRDLKPANIMVGAFGEVQVMDWGLAKILRSRGEGQGPKAADEDKASSLFLGSAATDHEETAAGRVMGTLAYMAPEQARGDIESLDQRADVFGLGGVLCDVLTGKPPFAGGSLQDKLRRAMQGDLAEAFTRLDHCGADTELIQLAKQCLAPDKNARPADATAVAAAVAKFQADLQRRLKQAEIHQARVQARLIEEAKRRRVRAALILVSVLFALAAGGTGVWYLQEQARSDADQAARKEILEAGMMAALDEEEQKQNKLHDRLTDPTKVHVLLSTIDEWQTILTTRAGILKNATKLWASGQGLLAADLQERLQQQQDRLKGDEKDFKLGEELDIIRLKAATANEGKFDTAAAAGEYAGVFARLELDVQQGNPATVAAQISKSPVRLVLVAALDHWAQVAPFAKVKVDAKLVSRLMEVAKRVDPDPWRDQVRDAVAMPDTAKLQELANEAKPEKQSPQIILLLARNLPAEGSAGAELLGKALAHHPSDFWLHYHLGYTLKDPAEQVGCYRAALAVRPTSHATHTNLGIALKAKGDLDGAITQYQQAITLAPKHAKVHYNLGLALKAKGDLDGAITQYQKAFSLDPKDALAHNNLGNALKAKGDLDGAITQFQKAISLNPKYAPAHHSLGIALAAKGDLDGAITQYQQAITLDPKDALAHSSLGTTLLAKKDLDGAITAYTKAVELNPKDVFVHGKLGTILRDRKDLDGAIAAFKKVIELDPKDVWAYRSLGDILRDKKDLDGASTAYKKVIEFDPKNAAAYDNLGWTLSAKGDLDGAITQYQKAITLDPKYAYPQVNLGLALLGQGKFAEARQCLTKGLTLLPVADHTWRKFVQEKLQECDQLMAVDQKVSAILQGEATPGTAAEQLQLAEFCHKYKKYYTTAANFYVGALSKEPQLAGAPGQGHRYQAACAAAGQGKGLLSDQLTANDQAQLRQQALAWLRADLQLLTQTVAAYQAATRDGNQPPASPLAKLTGPAQKPGPADLLRVCDRLQRWQQGPDLASLREEKELAKLSAAEQQDWRRLWAEVEQLLTQARTCFTERRLTGSLTTQQQRQVHPLELQAGKTYVFDLESQQFAPFLRLEDSQGKVLAEKDIEPGVNLNSRLVFTAPRDATYQLIATSVQGRGTGAYVLIVRTFVSQKQ